MNPAELTDEETFPEASGSQSDRKTSISINTIDVLSVNQLLESVRKSLYFIFSTSRNFLWNSYLN